MVRRRQDHVRGEALYYLRAGDAGTCYPAYRILVNSRFGNVLVAIRENPERAELLGSTSGAINSSPSSSAARWPGERCALHRWGQFMCPLRWRFPRGDADHLVAVGGRKDLTATLIGSLFVLWLFRT